jgi:hypothetical protein
VKPENQASFMSFVVPVFPAASTLAGKPILRASPAVPEVITLRIMFVTRNADSAWTDARRLGVVLLDHRTLRLGDLEHRGRLHLQPQVGEDVESGGHLQGRRLERPERHRRVGLDVLADASFFDHRSATFS